MINVALYEPEIPPNTGNIIRLCANTGAALHLIEPLGFKLDDRSLRRAGLDYREFAKISVHKNYAAFCNVFAEFRIFGFSTHATKTSFEVQYQENDVLLFGPETRGLPDSVKTGLLPDRLLKIPMREDSRSLNLSNAVSVAVYEFWRQRDFST